MKFVCYTDWNQLPESADALFDDGSRTSIFFSRPWFENLTGTVLQDDQSLLLACVVEADSVLAILPLMTRDKKHLYGLTHLYSSLYSLLLSEQNQQEIIQSLAQGLDELPIESLRLDPVAEDDCNVHMLQQVMESMGYQCHHRFRFYNWIHRTQGQSFEDYMATRPSRVRNTIARKRRKLEREHDYEIRLYTDQSMQQALADYNTVYRASWKAFEQFDAFIEGLVNSLSAAGWLRLAILYIEDKPAAAQFWLVAHGKASIFKLVYDQAWKHYSPGSILISYLMEHVIEIDKVEEIDFLTGNDAYKQDWMSERRKRWAVSFFKANKPRGMIERLINPLKTMFLTK
jgi:hypothetical protein